MAIFYLFIYLFIYLLRRKLPFDRFQYKPFLTPTSPAFWDSKLY